jgi:hypothetical protein
MAAGCSVELGEQRLRVQPHMLRVLPEVQTCVRVRGEFLERSIVLERHQVALPTPVALGDFGERLPPRAGHVAG